MSASTSRPVQRHDQNPSSVVRFEVRGVVRRFRGAPAPILSGVDLTISGGEIAWIEGRNGTGKTTLMRVAAGILAADEGSVSLDGLDPIRDRQRFHAQLGFLSAGDRGLHARLTVAQHLDYWAKLAYVPKAERAGAIAESVDVLGLGALLSQRVDRLSMGQRQRLRLALALLHEPAVALLDEPRNSLDDEGYASLNVAVERLRLRGGALVWCSPQGEEPALPFDARYVLESGKLWSQ